MELQVHEMAIPLTNLAAALEVEQYGVGNGSIHFMTVALSNIVQQGIVGLVVPDSRWQQIQSLFREGTRRMFVGLYACQSVARAYEPLE